MEKRQKIRGLALGLLCAAFALSGCERSEEEPLALLTLDKERIVFDNPAEGETAQAVLRIEADRRWSVGFIGNGHDCRVSVLSGEAGVHELRIETSETNTGRDLHRLGQLTVALDDGSANRTVDLQQRPQAARQTLLMYFCGTDLYSYYKNNLSDVAKALSRNILPLGRIVAFTQPAAGEGYVVEYRYDEAANACERDTLIRYTPLPGRTTDPAVMERILGDMAAAAPAERFGLHLASHAKGWLPASIESSSWLRSNARRTDDLWRKIPGAAETRWFGHDRGRYMDISELAAAIDGSGVRFDYLLFDACFMSSVEALYDLRRAADYIVASPCEVMAHGFPRSSPTTAHGTIWPRPAGTSTNTTTPSTPTNRGARRSRSAMNWRGWPRPCTTSTPAPRKPSTRRRCKATTEWRRTSSTIWKSTPWR